MIQNRLNRNSETEINGTEALMQKGRIEMGREWLVKQLAIKFGLLAESIVSRVNSLREKRLENLAE